MMMGTEIWPAAEAWQNKILLLEVSEMQISPEMLLILLRSLAAQGILAQVKGILFGKPVDEKYYQEYKAGLLQVIRDECRLPELPIVYNMNFGHTAPIVSLPIGCELEIDCRQQTVSIKESPVC